MARKKKIGIVYNYNENWIGGTYYIENLLAALGTLDEKDRPQVFVVSKSKESYEALQKKVPYPNLQWLNVFSFSLSERIINKIGRILLKKPLIDKRVRGLDIIFPLFRAESSVHPGQPSLFWIPDLQEHFFPAFFTQEELAARRAWHQDMIDQKGKILFSSKAARNDFVSVYPGAGTTNYVVPFAVTHQPYDQLSIETLRAKYELPPVYFMSPNQFWVHKNHKVLINAAAELKKAGEEVVIALTGKPYDSRKPEYYQELLDLTQANGLEKNIRFLGFIDRQEQLQLMNHARAIIQPSKFEGWSTVIEDAKAMNQFVLASDIPVHLEQAPNGVFFNPDDPSMLAGLLKQYSAVQPERSTTDYRTHVRKFAADFLNTID
ncbi:MAG: glycosyltransferase family 1 protein [Candidatus Pseudobacter hemicellulosilyticus]|uniref:Glycosyltransferase family 1 protein n=1 Tax=Candidatus Pseudobacter hemicellulosilyticus TaxID=3121375 RepID=A0AAJ5WUU1_9BACT|nr:MAG: glycosyltransferase family 1 protein [Pseudobacter sp.]